MDTFETAQELVNLAKDYRRRGMHPQARDAFRRAAVMFGSLHQAGLASWCWTQHDNELAQCRPAAKANVTALVD